MHRDHGSRQLLRQAARAAAALLAAASGDRRSRPASALPPGRSDPLPPGGPHGSGSRSASRRRPRARARGGAGPCRLPSRPDAGSGVRPRAGGGGKPPCAERLCGRQDHAPRLAVEHHVVRAVARQPELPVGEPSTPGASGRPQHPEPGGRGGAAGALARAPPRHRGVGAAHLLGDGAGVRGSRGASLREARGADAAGLRPVAPVRAPGGRSRGAAPRGPPAPSRGLQRRRARGPAALHDSQPGRKAQPPAGRAGPVPHEPLARTSAARGTLPPGSTTTCVGCGWPMANAAGMLSGSPCTAHGRPGSRSSRRSACAATGRERGRSPRRERVGGLVRGRRARPRAPCPRTAARRGADPPAWAEARRLQAPASTGSSSSSRRGWRCRRWGWPSAPARWTSSGWTKSCCGARAGSSTSCSTPGGVSKRPVWTSTRRHCPRCSWRMRRESCPTTAS